MRVPSQEHLQRTVTAVAAMVAVHSSVAVAMNLSVVVRFVQSLEGVSYLRVAHCIHFEKPLEAVAAPCLSLQKREFHRFCDTCSQDEHEITYSIDSLDAQSLMLTILNRCRRENQAGGLHHFTYLVEAAYTTLCGYDNIDVRIQY